MASKAAAGPLIVTGHQPELFHPGVWIKNFAAGGIAGEQKGLRLNLIVDNDLPKSASIRVPSVADGLVRTTAVDYDRWAGEIPYEDLRVQDEELFGAFPRERAGRDGGRRRRIRCSRSTGRERWRGGARRIRSPSGLHWLAGSWRLRGDCRTWRFP